MTKRVHMTEGRQISHRNSKHRFGSRGTEQSATHWMAPNQSIEPLKRITANPIGPRCTQLRMPNLQSAQNLSQMALVMRLGNRQSQEAFLRLRPAEGQAQEVSPSPEETEVALKAYEEAYVDFNKAFTEVVLNRTDWSIESSEDAIKVLRLWGISIESIREELIPRQAGISKGTSGQVAAAEYVDLEQASLAELDENGKACLDEVLTCIRKEPFWDEFLKGSEVHVFPDLPPDADLVAFVKPGTRKDNGQEKQVFEIHLKYTVLNKKETTRALKALVHELSHARFRSGFGESFGPSLSNLASLLADVDEIAELRKGAKEPNKVRDKHIRAISSILRSQMGVRSIDEIFALLQELMCPRPITPADPFSDEWSASQVLDTVEEEIARLRRLPISEADVQRVLDCTEKWVEIFYNMRISRMPEELRGIHQRAKENAIKMLENARMRPGF